MGYTRPSVTEQLETGLVQATARFIDVEGYTPTLEIREKFAFSLAVQMTQFACEAIPYVISMITEEPARSEGADVKKRIQKAMSMCNLSDTMSESVQKNTFHQLLKDLSTPTESEKFWLTVPSSGKLSREATQRFSEILNFYERHVSEAI